MDAVVGKGSTYIDWPTGCGTRHSLIMPSSSLIRHISTQFSISEITNDLLNRLEALGKAVSASAINTRDLVSGFGAISYVNGSWYFKSHQPILYCYPIKAKEYEKMAKDAIEKVRLARQIGVPYGKCFKNVSQKSPSWLATNQGLIAERVLAEELNEVEAKLRAHFGRYLEARISAARNRRIRKYRSWKKF